MAITSHSFLLTITFLLASTYIGASTALGARKALAAEATAPSPSPISDEAFVTLDTNKSDVVELAKFAVDEYNKGHKVSLNFRGVSAAAYTFSSKGLNYGLVIAAVDEKGVNDYDANVLVNDGAKKLIAFWKKNE